MTRLCVRCVSLRRSYNPEVAFPSDCWACPSCQGFCVCAACSRGVEGCEREGLTGAMATLSQMNPLILALLGVDERKLAQLQAVINTPQLMATTNPAQAGLLASMLASANTHSLAGQPPLNQTVLAGVPGVTFAAPSLAGIGGVGMGMQELNLNHYEPASILSQPAGVLSMQPMAPYASVNESQLRMPVQSFMEPVAPLQSLHSSASTTSTVNSPYGSSSAYSSSSNGTSSSSSSPQLRPAMSVPQPITASLLSLPVSVFSGTPTSSPRALPRGHTQPQPIVESIEHSPAMQRQRLFSHPPLPPLSSSTPTMSRMLPQPSEHGGAMLHELSPLHGYSEVPYAQQPPSRKRSYSTTLAEADAAAASRHRFVLPPHIVQQAQMEFGRERIPVAADLSAKPELAAKYDTHWVSQQQSGRQQPFVLEHELEMRKRLAEAAWKQDGEAAYGGQHAHEAEALLQFDLSAHPAVDYQAHPTY